MRNNKGFTLVMALIVLTLLSVMLGLFITMVSVNLRHANRFIARTTLDQVANDGIEYCNNMLINSALGADWRPIPDNISMVADWTSAGVNVAPDVSDTNVDIDEIYKNDPDYKWLIPYWPVELYKDGMLYAGPSGGYTRMNAGDNRFLIRVTYAPLSLDSSLNNFQANYYDQASKFIKIESIGRKGNIDEDDPTTKLSANADRNQSYLVAFKPIGITDYCRFITNKDKQNKTFVLGSGIVAEKLGRVNTRYTKRGAPIRVNGDLTFDNTSVVLRALKGTDVNGDTVISPRDMVECTGTISGINYKVYDQDFNDISGDIDEDDFLKSTESDEYGISSVNELVAPLIDRKIENNKTTRYRELTKNSGTPVAAENGWGDGIYINNKCDVQKESETLFGGYSLRSDWLNPGNLFSGNWKGPYYIPCGVVVVLRTDGIEIQKTDFDKDNISTVWRDENGNPRVDWGSTVVMDYPKNGVLYAEGNIRIKGMLPSNTQLTVVSNENIYIEGNILKNRPNNTSILESVDTDSYSIVDKSCAISLLARKNVVVNTTMFMRPEMSLGPDVIKSDIDESNEPPYHIRLNPMNASAYLQWRFQFGPYESEENLFDGREWQMDIRHSADISSVDAYLQTFNYNNNKWLDIYWGETNSAYYTGVPTLKNTISGGTSLDITSDNAWKYKSQIYKLYDTDFYDTSLGIDEFVKIFLSSSSIGEYILGNMFICPMDIRIEAMMYAQNGSFFVIPGYWFEPDINKEDDNIWDFGKPLDARIIVDGAISENSSANKSDQISWMEKWGKTYHPDTNLSTSPIYGKNSFHNGAGFTILYDDTITYPINNSLPIRYDEYGRVLPITPKLPVSETLIYKGTGN